MKAKRLEARLEARRTLAEDNKRWPPYLVPVPREEWPALHRVGPIVEVWRSRTLLVQVREPRNGAQWVSVNRTALDDTGRFRDGLTWDELQEVKRQIGRGDRWAVELYPADDEVENINNIRHLWLLDEEPPFGFRPSRQAERKREGVLQ